MPVGVSLLVAAGFAGTAPLAAAEPSAYVQAVQSDGPVAYYQLGDAVGSTGAGDSVGANPMSAYNGVTFGAAGPPGVGTTAVSLNGSNQYLATAQSVLSQPSNWTVEGWFNPATASQAGMMAYDGDDLGGFGFGMFAPSPPNGGSGGCLSGLFGGVAWLYPGPQQCFTPGTWYYLVLESDSRGNTSFFVNGQLVSVGEWAGGGYAPVAPVGATELGAEYDASNNPSRYFQGSVSQVAFYDHALSAAQILNHYAAATDTPPRSTTAPVISGTAQDGQSLSADNGAWSGSTPLSYTYQWESCDASGANCQPIAGAVGSSFRLDSSEVGQTIRVQVSASNPAGSAAATSSPTASVAGSPPSNTTVPSITGTLTPGRQLSASTGDWSGTTPLSYSYQWQSCDGSGTNCQDIVGATQSSYTVASSDLGNTLVVIVSASNSVGSASATSDPTDAIGYVPVSTAGPSISGMAQDGQTLTVTNGDWTGTAPLSYAYQWQDCDAFGNDCQDISGATDSSYDISSSDVGSTIVARVTASNALGAATVASNATSVVSAVAPANTAPPEIDGTPQDGQTLQENGDMWSGTDPSSYAYQWQLCDPSGANCQDISGATDWWYTPDSSDIGSTLVVEETVTNPAGTASASSAPSGVITAAPPSNTDPPTISGTAEDGQTLTANEGAWAGTGPLSYAYQWELCDSRGGNCQAIAGATDATYTIDSSDIGDTLVVQVTATNSLDSVVAVSAATEDVAGAPPANVSAPVVTGNLQDGQTLSASLGDWSGTQPLSYWYQWERCDPTGLNCQEIYGASSSTYQLTPADVGNTIAVQVGAWSWVGSGEATSNPSTAVEPLAPANQWAPKISGTPQSGLTLRAVGSEWSGTPPFTYTYQWLSCEGSGANCVPIAGATDATYTPSDTDVGTTIEVTVSVDNAAGNASATSPPTGAVSSAAPSIVTINYGYDANGRLTSVSGR